MKAVTVACRSRPLQANEEAGHVVVDHPRVTVSASQGERTFTFDQAFGPESTDDIIWEKLQMSRLTEQVLEGYHTTIMAYGQTGSGKTYTIDGASDNGVVSRAASSLFEQMQTREDRFAVTVSYMQLYLEKTFDLLNPAPWLMKTSNDRRRCEHLQRQSGLRLRANLGGWYVENLFETECANAEEIMHHWHYGRESKQMAQTAMNAHSSRSHTLFTIKVERYDPKNEKLGPLSISKMTVVDLAGSEKPGVNTATRFTECVNINGSLFVLRKVITALVHGSTHIPYRESKLTCLLKQSIGGSSYLVMLACVNPTQSSQEETISTLHYASQASHIQNAPTANKDPKLELIEQLRAQVEILQRHITDTLNEPLPDLSAWKVKPVPAPNMRRSRSANAIRRKIRASKDTPLYNPPKHNTLEGAKWTTTNATDTTISALKDMVHAAAVAAAAANRNKKIPSCAISTGGSTPSTNTPRNTASDEVRTVSTGDETPGGEAVITLSQDERPCLEEPKNRRTSSVPCIRRNRSPQKKSGKNPPRCGNGTDFCSGLDGPPGSKTAEFLAQTADAGTAGITNVRALARWFHDQRKEVLYGPPRRAPKRAPQLPYGAAPSTSRSSTKRSCMGHQHDEQLMPESENIKAFGMECGTQATSEKSGGGMSMPSSSKAIRADADVLLTVAQKRQETVWLGENAECLNSRDKPNADEKSHRNKPRSSNPSPEGSRECKSAIQSENSRSLIPPKRNSTPRRSLSTSGARLGASPLNRSSRPHSSRFRHTTTQSHVNNNNNNNNNTTSSVNTPRSIRHSHSLNSTRRSRQLTTNGNGNGEAGKDDDCRKGTDTTTSASSAHSTKYENMHARGTIPIPISSPLMTGDGGADDLDAMSPQHAAEQVACLFEQNELLHSQEDMYLEKIRDQEYQITQLCETLEDFQDAARARQDVQHQITDQLQEAYNDTADQKRELEEAMTRKVELLEAQLQDKEKKIKSAHGRAQELSHRLMAAEEVAVSNLITIGNEAKPTQDIKAVLRDVLEEWTKKRFLDDKNALELRKEVNHLRKKKGLLLSMMGKVEAMQLKEEMKEFRERNIMSRCSDREDADEWATESTPTRCNDDVCPPPAI